ncbi:DUF2207 domain-containing protein [Pseudoclavibacter sp. 13-3]|uniref:DUF2207 domain-containing protein n=1 Tax=Pseudoclavibacter sp. 13-3 TaxID=2901228 RepID=UPI001E3E6FE5|nr:DUF2207 domain-containing protein [Pseudoclavibacter sp. 13-3]MCD7100677.1 DUF2207 domain-containing protein [Pseudoclavibacter sp. 13-3]
MRTSPNSAPTPATVPAHRSVTATQALRLPRSAPVRLAAVLLATALLALAVMVTSARPAAASVDDFSFESMSVDYHLSRDAGGRARLDVTETLIADFPSFDQNRGLVRKIPLDYDGVSLDPTITAVTDEAGRAVVYDTKRSGGQLEVSLGTDDFVHGRQTYVLSYTMQNTVRHFTDTGTDEFYWDVNGESWQQPFAVVSATVTVDSSLVPALNGQSACYQGAHGSTAQCHIVRADDSDTSARFTAQSDGGLAPAQTMTVAVGFAPQTFVIPEPPSRAWWATWLPLGLSAAALALAVALVVVRSRRWRDAPGRGVIIPEYAPPKGLPLVAGADLVNRMNSWMPASVIDMAVRGVVRMVDIEHVGVFGSKRASFAIEMVDPTRLQAHDAEVLAVLTGPRQLQPGERVPIETKPDQHRAERAQSVISDAQQRLLAGGLRAVPATALPLALRVAGWGMMAVSAAYGLWALVQAERITWWLIAAGAATVGSLLLLFVALPRPKTLTEAGAEARDAVKGLKMYMELAERDRFAVLQSVHGAERVDLSDGSTGVRLNERLLPWAVLWGIEGTWARQLQIDYERTGSQPGWYDSTTPFTAGVLAARLAAFNTATTTSVQPPSSGGSFSGGAGGGGFAGGGGGGGGGGGR